MISLLDIEHCIIHSFIYSANVLEHHSVQVLWKLVSMETGTKHDTKHTASEML